MPRVIVTSERNGGLTLYVIDKSDWVGWAAAALTLGEYYMTNTESFVRVVRQVGKKAKIRRLNVLDHGNKYGFELGNDFIRSETLPKYQKQLARIRGVFHRRGWVHLWGCETGLATKLMKSLAKLWGVPVVSGTGKQHALFGFNTGKFIECYPDGKCRQQ